MSKPGEILKIGPQLGLPGGEVSIDCENFDTSDPTLCAVWFGEERASIVALSPKRALVVVPELRLTGEVEVRLESGGVKSAPANITIGRRLAEDLHPVSSPAFDPDDGSLFVTRSGARGEHLPVTLFRIDVNGEVNEFSGDIANPTAIAFDSSGQMFVTSRMDGTVYRVTPFKEAVPFAHNLGVATGIAIDSSDTMYVGDRTGTIYKVNGIGEETAWAQLEPSVSAYHLAISSEDEVYVTGPTVGSFDSVMRINAKGEVSTFYRGLGRPQGLAFDRSGNLLVAAALRGRRGIVRISPDGKSADVMVAGVNLVGLAFNPAGDLAIVSTDSVYHVPMGRDRD
jgi:sugar lactone lactonase YvrE